MRFGEKLAGVQVDKEEDARMNVPQRYHHRQQYHGDLSFAISDIDYIKVSVGTINESLR